MMEWTNHVEVDRANPVVVVDDRHYVETPLVIWQRFYDDAEGSNEMTVVRFGYPVALLLSHAYLEKQLTSTNTQRNALATQMIALLENAEFNGKPFSKQQTQQLISQGQALLNSVNTMAMKR